MQPTIQLIQITPEELESRILDGIKKAFQEVMQNFNKEEELMKRTEAARFLGISSVTLWDWTNKGKIKSYGLGNKVFYKKSELLEALTPLK